MHSGLHAKPYMTDAISIMLPVSRGFGKTFCWPHCCTATASLHRGWFEAVASPTFCVAHLLPLAQLSKLCLQWLPTSPVSNVAHRRLVTTWSHMRSVHNYACRHALCVVCSALSAASSSHLSGHIQWHLRPTSSHVSPPIPLLVGPQPAVALPNESPGVVMPWKAPSPLCCLRSCRRRSCCLGLHTPAWPCLTKWRLS